MITPDGDTGVTDPFDLERFLSAQEGTYEDALQELRSGQKRSHWMWYVFPQIQGLGTSDNARRYAIKNLEEAQKYLEHSVLGARLMDCTKTVNKLKGKPALQIFGSPDDKKFFSSMTLFEFVAGQDSEYALALKNFYSGSRDSATLKLLQISAGANE